MQYWEALIKCRREKRKIRSVCVNCKWDRERKKKPVKDKGNI